VSGQLSAVRGQLQRPPVVESPAMAAWRQKASLLFPQLKRDLNDKGFTIYMVFFDLLIMARDAHEAGDDESIRRIYGFGEWCLRQKAKDLRNAAGVAFYEHLVDDPKLWPLVVPWLSPIVISQVSTLWAARLNPADYSKFDKLIRGRMKTRYKELESVK